MNNLKIFSAAILILLMAATAGAAGPPTKGDFKQTVRLTESDYGREVGAFGYCTLQRANGVEMFGLRVFADLPDESILIVAVTTEKETFEVGAIKLFLGSGSLILYSSDRPSPAFPLVNVVSVSVYSKEGMVLDYTWGRTLASAGR